MTSIIFDSSSLISITQTCLSRALLEELVEETKMKYLISEIVYQESIANPLNVKRFELTATRILELVENNYLEVFKTTPEMRKETSRLMGLSNAIYSMNGHNLGIIQAGEAESLALLNLSEEGILCIDERTTRMLVEEPKALQNYLEFKFKGKMQVNQSNMKKFGQSMSEVSIIRSSELLALAFKRGLLPKKKSFLDGAFYALKFSGCSVSEDEVNDYMAKVKI